MKLLDSLYTIVAERPAVDGHEYDIRWNPEHFIYKAHFPGEPITPGVCIMQTAVELVSKATEKPLAIKVVKNIKFLRLITPGATPEVCFSISRLSVEEDTVKAMVTVKYGDDAYAKLSLVCQIAQ